jgi:hypothetical protein
MKPKPEAPRPAKSTNKKPFEADARTPADRDGNEEHARSGGADAARKGASPQKPGEDRALERERARKNTGVRPVR